MKIAPKLQALVSMTPKWWTPKETSAWRAELRALLAVARAARREFDETYFSEALTSTDPLARSLARLEKVSQPVRETPGRRRP
jgi:hypothetical protein